MHLSSTTLSLSIVPLLLTTILLPNPALSWGALGHRTVAYLASLHFTPNSHLYTRHLLNAQDISEAALFADKIVHMPLFSYTRPWHYIDALDTPPTHCSINITRDCLDSHGGCVVSAIANHTARVNDRRLEYWERAQALRFVLHWFGDVVQPLHTENLDRGGNEHVVTYAGRKTNLHSVWDTAMPRGIVEGKAWWERGMNDTTAAWLWASELSGVLEGGEEEKVCTSDAGKCALGWAEEANKWVCDFVMKDLDQVEDLAGEYFDGAVPIIEGQIRKGGKNLAAWINMLSEQYYRHDL